MLGYFGHMWELYAMWTWFAAFAALSVGAGPRTGSAVVFVAIASGAIGCVMAGRWADAVGKANVAAIAMLASASCALISPFFFGAPLELHSEAVVPSFLKRMVNVSFLPPGSQLAGQLRVRRQLQRFFIRLDRQIDFPLVIRNLTQQS